jgi:hypothetical protein
LGRAARTTGDQMPFAATEFESLNHTFVIPAQQASRDVWLRLATSSTQLMHVEALTPRDMLREEHTLWLAYSTLLAVLFSCLLWVFISWLCADTFAPCLARLVRFASAFICKTSLRSSGMRPLRLEASADRRFPMQVTLRSGQGQVGVRMVKAH